MAHTRYLFQKAGLFYFRRRISGFPQKTKPIMVSLGCKDPRLAYVAVQKLLPEYDAMLHSFIYVNPPLPEALISKYISVQLRQLMAEMQRNMRQARMSGRTSVGDHQRVEFQKEILSAMLECGLERVFPARRIRPEWTEADLETVMRLYDQERQDLLSRVGRQNLFDQFAAATRTDATRFNSEEHECQVREAYLHAKLAALDANLDNTSDQIENFRQQAKALVRSDAQKEMARPINQPVQAAPQPKSRPAPNIVSDLTARKLINMHDKAKALKSNGAYTSDIASIFWRLAEVEKFSDDMAKQRASDLRLFSLVTGVVDVRDIEQHHLSKHRDALGQIPKTFQRSDKDQDLTFKDLMARSELLKEADLGLAPSTMKRHLKSIELVLQRAKSEGHDLHPDLDLSRLQPKVKSRTQAHKRRSVFRFEELQKLFGHTVWTGCRSEGRRHLKGNQVIKDAKFWVPLMLAYTGARRAEIAGLLHTDIETIDGVPCVHIRANRYRKIKGEDDQVEKSRIVPIHPHLIALGLMEKVQDSKGHPTGLLFPDVLPMPRKRVKGAKLALPKKIGDTLDDFWRESLKRTLDGNPRNLCMHSLRHYVNNHLIHAGGVHEVTRLDLLGHVDGGAASQSINTSTYRDETGVKEKLAAITALPRIF
jgi:integrase